MASADQLLQLNKFSLLYADIAYGITSRNRPNFWELWQAQTLAI